MGTLAVQETLVLQIPTEILGPGSEYDKRRLVLKGNYESIVLEASHLTEINTPEDAGKAANLGRILQAGTKDAEEFYTPIKRQCDAVKAPVLAHEKEFLSLLNGQKIRLGMLLTTWDEKCMREKEAADRAAREEAERQAREEQLARAIELEQSGDAEAAEQVLEEPVFAPAVTQTYSLPKVAGKVGKTNYGCIVENFKDLVKAVADGRAPIQCLKADEQFLNQQARSFKEAFSIPGCKLDRNSKTHFRA
jgi:hypothetical protein